MAPQDEPLADGSRRFEAEQVAEAAQSAGRNRIGRGDKARLRDSDAEPDVAA
jgi:hypothetical protein